MDISLINPFVRFVRMHEKRINEKQVSALDHRIFYCVSGEGKIRVSDVVYHIKSGDLIFWKAGVAYNSEGKDFPTLIACNFDFFTNGNNKDTPISYISTDKFSPFMLSENADGFPDCIHIQKAPVKDKFAELMSEYGEKKPYCKEKCSAILKDILVYMLRESERPEKSDCDYILEYVRNHFDENLTNARLGEIFSYHPNYISTMVKKSTGITLHKYLINYRIHMATLFLQSGEYNVTETAMLTGFCDIKHFSRCFKQITGRLPREFK